jgi:tricarballylate dehydrogenase
MPPGATVEPGKRPTALPDQGAPLREDWDVIVVGAGNAAMCAALAARDCGASVLVLERAPPSERGGNTAFTAGAMRVTYQGVDDLLELIPDLTAEELARTDFGSYRAEDFRHDLGRLTEYRADPELVDAVVRDSHPTLRWLRDKGVRFAPAFGRQAFRIGERMRFWGGLTVEVSGGGQGLTDRQHEVAIREGVEIRYEAPALALLYDDRGVTGL